MEAREQVHYESISKQPLRFLTSMAAVKVLRWEINLSSTPNAACDGYDAGWAICQGKIERT